MANVCETCKDLEKYKYWHDVQNIRHQFFKIMLRDFEHHLRIPRNFIECFTGDISHSSTLKGPSGNVWGVQIIKTEEDVRFSNGWGNFVRDHGIKEGYFLVFRYVGHSSFEVLIFNNTGCEDESSHFTKNMNMSSNSSCRSLLHLENGEGNQSAKYAAAYKGKGKVDESYESKDRKKQASNFEEELKILSDEECQMGFDRLNLRRRETSQGKQYKRHYISNRRKVTEQEKKYAKDMACSHKKSSRASSRKRMFEIVMRPTHVYDGFHLTIPKEWALVHMLPKDHEAILRVPGVEESWVVGCRWTSSRQCQIRPRWSTFVLENNLEEHDVCVFELVQKGQLGKNRRPIFDVHIFRVVSEVVPLTVLVK